MVRKMSGRGVIVAFTAVILASACGCAVSARARSEASNSRLKRLALMAIIFESANGVWPDRLDQLETYARKGEWDNVITNPVTGDKPGYEYVKPAGNSVDAAIFYQLRGGMRDLSLPAACADGSVRPPASQ